MRRWLQRWHCHGDPLCCQHLDTPECETWYDPHRVARFLFRYGLR